MPSGVDGHDGAAVGHATKRRLGAESFRMLGAMPPDRPGRKAQADADSDDSPAAPLPRLDDAGASASPSPLFSAAGTG